jgi:ribosomal protein S18 acetylase RimI-like enzyme
MVYVNFNYNEYKFSSVEEEDLSALNLWIKENNQEGSILDSLDPQLFYRRFLEYYVTENESFIKVTRNGEIIAAFKGRFEFNKKKELFVWLFIMEKKLRNEGLGTEIINNILECFRKQFNINRVQVGVVEKNINGIAFWNSLGFETMRIAKNFFQTDDINNGNLVIMGKKIS